VHEVRSTTVSHTIPSEATAGFESAGSVAVGPAARAAATSSDCDLFTLLGDLSDAISVVTVVHRSLAALEIAAVGDEETALRYALTLLRTTYSALDMFSSRSS
jgi:hypothetical protein